MSADQIFSAGRASNNPFLRNSTASASGLSPQGLSFQSPFDDPIEPTAPKTIPPPRPLSRNPFLDPPPSLFQSHSLGAMSHKSDDQAIFDATADELFGNLSLKEPNKANSPETRSPQLAPAQPRPDARRPSGSQQPSRRDEFTAHRDQGPQWNENLLDSQISPGKHRPRRSSDPEARNARDDLQLTEEEKRKIRRDRERKAKNEGSRNKPGRVPRARHVDIIDELDVYYGALFHHDGPYDALMPGRNKRGNRQAPVEAFPKNSLNNTLGGSGPLNNRPDHKTFMGNGEPEAFNDYAAGTRSKESSSVQPVFDPKSRGDILHGDESLGLGTSTFLEGTPAARTVIQRQQEEEAKIAATEELTRETLARRLLSVKRSRRAPGGPDPQGSLDETYAARKASRPISPPQKDLSPPMESLIEFDHEPESLSVRKPSRNSENTFDRRPANDSSEDQSPRSAGGLLSRVKSLKGSKKNKAQPLDVVSATSPSPFPTPGTAV